ncbi:MAG: hypothetical protein SFW62_09680 [Alphaproteobacteria bacterium]|nr:hypothetical protein [Alphaproteobacteria bacterium]
MITNTNKTGSFTGWRIGFGLSLAAPQQDMNYPDNQERGRREFTE